MARESLGTPGELSHEKGTLWLARSLEGTRRLVELERSTLLVLVELEERRVETRGACRTNWPRSRSLELGSSMYKKDKEKAASSELVWLRQCMSAGYIRGRSVGLVVN